MSGGQMNRRATGLQRCMHYTANEDGYCHSHVTNKWKRMEDKVMKTFHIEVMEVENGWLASVSVQDRHFGMANQAPFGAGPVPDERLLPRNAVFKDLKSAIAWVESTTDEMTLHA